MRYFFPSLICIVSMLFFVFDITSADDELIPHSSSRIFGFCCGTVKNKCATGCAGKNCDITCSGTCGIFNTACSYTCGQVTNACNAATTTTTTTTTTTATACIASGQLCMSISEGSKGTCCSGSSCNV